MLAAFGGNSESWKEVSGRARVVKHRFLPSFFLQFSTDNTSTGTKVQFPGEAGGGVEGLAAGRLCS